MTSERQTVMLNAGEWRGVTLTNIAQLHQFLNGKSAVGPEDLAALDEHIDRFRLWVRQWAAACAKEAVPAVPQGNAAANTGASADAAPAPQPAPNGAEPAKRKGGWPKGRKRVPRVMEAVQ